MFDHLKVMNLLFFAAFGNQNVTEKTIEEYIEALMVDEKPGGNIKWVCGSAVSVATKQLFLEESKDFMLAKEMALKFGNAVNADIYGNNPLHLWWLIKPEVWGNFFIWTFFGGFHYENSTNFNSKNPVRAV